MSGYIIDPMWFYWVSVADGLKAFCIVVSILISAIGFIFSIITYSDLDDDDDKKAFIKKCLIAAVILLAVSIMIIFIPSKETLIQMEIAKQATYDNTEMLLQKIKEATDYILENLK